jgi:hypothetical protein
LGGNIPGGAALNMVCMMVVIRDGREFDSGIWLKEHRNQATPS